MKLYAISDLHLNHKANWQALQNLPPFPEDWLLVGGDVSENIVQFTQAMVLLAERFDKVFWTPGNHDLWTLPNDKLAARGVFKYNQLVAICRKCGILTPEDPFVKWPLSDKPYWIVPTFTLYDYSFRPEHVPFENALAWAKETEVICTDEWLLYSDPFTSRAAWCQARCQYSEQRLRSLPKQDSIILLNHYPLRYDLVTLRRIPRFSLWCGTKRTESWQSQFRLKQVIYGHLHIRGTTWHDNTKFIETSLGYPRNWHTDRGITPYLQQILPEY